MSFDRLSIKVDEGQVTVAGDLDVMSSPIMADTVLQAVSSGVDFSFVDIGRWRSIEDFKQATQSDELRTVSSGLAGYQTLARLVPRRPKLTGAL